MLSLNELKLVYALDDQEWLETTIQLLKQRRFAELDLDNLIEELEDLGRERRNAVVSLLEQIIRHLLMYHYWTSEKPRNSPHWEAEIYGFKVQLNRLLTQNLRNYLEENLDSIYQSARKYIVKKTCLENLPVNNPYSLEQLTDEDDLG